MSLTEDKRKIDAEIAEEVFLHEVRTDNLSGRVLVTANGEKNLLLPEYSARWEMAALVLRRMRDHGFFWGVVCDSNEIADAYFWQGSGDDTDRYYGSASEAEGGVPLAISRAALNAVRHCDF